MADSVADTAIRRADKALIQRTGGIEYYRVNSDSIQLSLPSGATVTVPEKYSVLRFMLEEMGAPMAQQALLQRCTDGGFSEEEVREGLAFLEANGFAISGDCQHDPEPLIKLIESFGHMMALRAKMPTLTFALLGVGAIADAAQASIKALGGKPRVFEALPADTSGCDLIIACSDYDDFDFFRAANAHAIKTGAPLYVARLSRSRLIMGPYVVPRETPCFECYANRLTANSNFIYEFRGRTAGKRGGGSDLAEFPNDSLLARGVEYQLGLDIAWLIAGRGTDSREPEVRTVVLATGEVSISPVLRSPRCSACGTGRSEDVKWAVRDLL